MASHNAFLLVVAVAAALIPTLDAAKILGVFLIPSVSHQIVYQPIYRELSLRGHDVTVITPNPLKDPSLANLTEIDVSASYVAATKNDVSRRVDHWDMIAVLYNFTVSMVEEQLVHPEVQRLINDPSLAFDLILVEFLNPIVMAFGSKFRCPIIGVASLSVFYAGHQAVGNPVHPILHPDIMTDYGVELGFRERVDSVLYYLWYNYVYHYRNMPVYDAIARRYFGDGMPYLGDLERNVAMLFLNTNPVIHRARALPPNVIEMGNMHLKPKKPQPQDLQDFLDGADEGVIYFSLGSNVKSANIDATKRQTILAAFSELPYKILWKFENATMPGRPPNVRINPWLPQQDLLGHRNVKLFVTQGGLQSLEEAIANGVPLLGIPFFADQFYNTERVQELGIGLHQDLAALTKDGFKAKILEVAGNPRYKAKIAEISKLLRDKPMSGLEKAVWWSEYVIRHKGAPYLKNPAVNMSWAQFLLLDVLAFFALCLGVFLYLLCKFYAFTRRWIYAPRRSDKLKVS